MEKTTRLLMLMQVLRARQRPITAQQLADKLGVSVRTVYRDIDALGHLGASIDGSAGVGYLIRSGFFLPPMMFTDDEIDALVLGARWVQAQGDAGLTDAAQSSLDKIGGAGQAELREKIAESGLWAPRRRADTRSIDTSAIRLAIRTEQILRLSYRAAHGRATDRLIWPIALGYFEGGRVVAAWCALRKDFRHFRVDRIESLEPTGDRYPTARRKLVRAWRDQRPNRPDIGASRS